VTWPFSSPRISTGLTEELHAHALALGLAQLLLVDDQLGAGPPVGDGDVLAPWRRLVREQSMAV
jgi:hypothetical protein